MKGEKYKKKYQLSKDTDLTNKYLTSITNPTVQPDRKTEMGVPIPDTQKNTKKKISYKKNGCHAKK